MMFSRKKRFSITVGLTVFVCHLSAYADRAPLPSQSKLPERLVCQAQILGLPGDAEMRETGKFDITGLTEVELKTSIPDADFVDLSVGPLITEFGFSNFCDNSYSFVFFSDDLVKLHSGKLKQVMGLLYYFNADLNHDLDLPGEEVTQSISVTCGLPNK